MFLMQQKSMYTYFEYVIANHLRLLHALLIYIIKLFRTDTRFLLTCIL